VTLTSSDIVRDILLHVPPSYDPKKGTMLVLNFHGFTSNDWEQVLLTKMSAASDQKNFIVAYPDGVASSWNAGDCCGDAWTNSVDDIVFVKDMLAKLEGSFCIDPKRVYATGFSNGGFFSHRLGCEMADTFAAVAPVSGVLGMDPSQCKPSRPIPVIDFHGTSDPLVPYNGGAPITKTLGPLTFRSVAETISAWQSNDRCLVTPQTDYQHGDATCQEWSCAERSAVRLCTIDGGGHAWPGGLDYVVGGKTSTDISATDAMVDFFMAHPMP
jgi:polyhydroxybutyrate depolymerase